MNDFNTKLQGAQKTVNDTSVKMRTAFGNFGQTASGLYVPMDALQKGLDQVGTTAEKTKERVKAMDGAMKDTLNLLFGGMAMTAAVTAPFAMFAKSAMDASIGFESAFAGVRKTVDATEAEFQELENRYRSMAQEAPIAAEGFAKIGELAGQLGVRGVDNLTKFSDTIAKLGVSTNLGTEEASLSLARFANIMQLPIADVDRLAATIVALGNDMAARETEIVDFGLRIAASGKQIGLSSAQVMAFGTALAAVGINAEAGGTAISRVFAKLATAVAQGGEDLSMFAQVAGMSAEQFAKAFAEDAASAIVAFITGLKRLRDQGVNLFGVMATLEMDEIRVRNALMATAEAGDTLSKALGLASTAFEQNSALNTEASKRFATTESKIQMLKNTWAEFARRIGDDFAPALTNMVGLLKGMLQVASDLPAPIKAIAAVFGGLLAAVGPLMIGMYTLSMAIQGVKTALEMLKVASMAWVPVSVAVVAALAVLSLGALAFAAAQRKAAEENAQKAKSLIELRDRYDALQKVINDSAKSEAEHAQAGAEQKQVIEEIGKLFPNLISQWDEHGKAIAIDTQRLNENTAAIERNIKTNLEKTLSASQNKIEGLLQDREKLLKMQSDMSNLQRALINGLLLMGGDATGSMPIPQLPSKAGTQKRLGEIATELAEAQAEWQKTYTMLYGQGDIYGPLKAAPSSGEGINFGAPVSALTELEHLLKRLDAQWEIYKTGLGNAATGTAFVAKQQEYLAERMGLLGGTIDYLNSACGKSKAKTGEFSDATMELADKLDTARKELASSQAELAKIASPLMVAKTNLTMLEAQLDRTDAAWKTFKAGLGDAAKGAAFTAREQEYLSNRMTQLQGVIDATTKAYALSKAETGEFSDETLSLAQKLDTANQSLAETKARFAELSPAVVQAKTDLEAAKTAVTNLKDRMEELNEALSKAKDKYEATTKKVDKFKESNKEATTVIGQALGAMKDRIKEVEAKMGDLKSSTKDAQSGISAAFGVMKERVKEVADSIKEFSDAIKDAQDAIKDAQDGIKNALGAMKDRIKEVEDQIGDLKDGIADAKSSIADAFSVMTDRAKEVESQINRTRDAMQNLANVKLKGEGALDTEMADLQRREALIQLAMNQLQQTPAGRNSAQLKALQRQLDQIGLLKENIQLRRTLEFEPLRDELKRLVDDTKEMSFEDAKKGILDYQQQIVDLTATHASMTQQIDDLSASVGTLVPSVAKSNMTFAEAVLAIQTHKTAIETDSAALSSLTSLYASMVSDFERIRSSLATTIPDIGASLQSFDDAKKAIADAQKTIADAQKTIADYRLQIKTLTEEQTRMETVITGLRKSAADLVPEIKSADQTFDEAILTILQFMSTIQGNDKSLADLKTKHDDMSSRYDDLTKSLGEDLLPKIGIAGLSFDQAAAKIDAMRDLIGKNNEQLDGPSGLLALQEKQKFTVDILTYGMNLFNDELLNLNSKEKEASSALETLRISALSAASVLSAVRPAPAQPPVISPQPPGGGGGGGPIYTMATGALVTRPTLALVGESGPEGVFPLSALAARANAFANGIASSITGGFGGMSPEGSLAMAGGGGTFAPSFSIFMGERQFYDFVVSANENARRRGR